MRDEDRRTSLHHLMIALDDGGFRRGVERARCFVHDEDRRVGEEGAGDGETLALTGRELFATLADDGRRAVGHRGDQIGQACGLQGRRDLIVHGVRSPVPDVVGHARVEDEGILFDDTDVAAHVLEREFPHVLPVEEHTALFGVEETREEIGQRRLTASARADDRDDLTGGDLQVDAIEDLSTAAETEADTLEGESASAVGQGQRGRRLDHLWWRIE